jgi:hypothetical protein
LDIWCVFISMFTVFVPNVTWNKRTLSSENRRLFPSTKCFMAHKIQIAGKEQQNNINFTF